MFSEEEIKELEEIYYETMHVCIPCIHVPESCPGQGVCDMYRTYIEDPVEWRKRYRELNEEDRYITHYGHASIEKVEKVSGGKIETIYEEGV
jgi:hypothetical protein